LIDRKPRSKLQNRAHPRDVLTKLVSVHLIGGHWKTRPIPIRKPIGRVRRPDCTAAHGRHCEYAEYAEYAAAPGGRVSTRRRCQRRAAVGEAREVTCRP